MGSVANAQTIAEMGESVARVSFKGASDYAQALKQLEFTAEQGKLLEDAVKAGAKPVADEIRRRLDALPEAPFERLSEGEKFSYMPKGQKIDLQESFGLTPVDRDRRGFVHVKAGFDGYGSFPTKDYPRGLPNDLVARAAESGSSVRQKTPFVRPAVNATRKEAEAEMDKTIRQGLEEIFGK